MSMSSLPKKLGLNIAHMNIYRWTIVCWDFNVDFVCYIMYIINGHLVWGYLLMLVYVMFKHLSYTCDENELIPSVKWLCLISCLRKG